MVGIGMLSKQERNYLMFPKEFKKRYSENYCKKIRNEIRKKVIQTTIDFYLINRFEKEWWKLGTKRKSLHCFCTMALQQLLDTQYYSMGEKKRQDLLDGVLAFIWRSMVDNGYKGFIMDEETNKKMMASAKKHVKKIKKFQKEK